MDYTLLRKAVIKGQIDNLKAVLQNHPSKTGLKEFLFKKEIEFVECVMQEYASKNKLTLNPNQELRKATLAGLIKAKENYGDYYCPCRRPDDGFSYTKDYICPCAEGMKELEKQGSCYCGLFYKK